MVPEAREIAKRILSEHKVDRLDPKVIQEGDALMRQFEGL